MKDKRGFTLIELIVILALAGIVMLVVMSFFIANYKSYNRLNTESELQYQSQYIINFMTNKILEASEYKGSNEFVGADGTNVFKFNVVNEKLEFYDGTNTTEVGNYIIGLTIEHGSGTNEVEIELNLYKDNQPLDAKQTVYMRNAP